MFDKVEYEYYMLMDGEEIKVDNCFTNLYGTSYCKYNGYTYNNPIYRTVEISRQESYYLKQIEPFIPIIFYLFISYLVLKFFLLGRG